jgi:hypothetical protein
MLLTLQSDPERLFQPLAAGTALVSRPDRGPNHLFDLIPIGATLRFQAPQRFEALQWPRHRLLFGVADHSLSFTLDTLDLLNCISTWGRQDAIQELVAARYETGSHGLSGGRLD